jgi:hypothetical protein
MKFCSAAFVGDAVAGKTAACHALTHEPASAVWLPCQCTGLSGQCHWRTRLPQQCQCAASDCHRRPCALCDRRCDRAALQNLTRSLFIVHVIALYLDERGLMHSALGARVLTARVCAHCHVCQWPLHCLARAFLRMPSHCGCHHHDMRSARVPWLGESASASFRV